MWVACSLACSFSLSSRNLSCSAWSYQLLVWKQVVFSVEDFLIPKFKGGDWGTDKVIVNVDVYKEADVYVDELYRKVGEDLLTQSIIIGIITTWNHLVVLVEDNRFQNKTLAINSELTVTEFGAISGCWVLVWKSISRKTWKTVMNQNW